MLQFLQTQIFFALDKYDFRLNTEQKQSNRIGKNEGEKKKKKRTFKESCTLTIKFKNANL